MFGGPRLDRSGSLPHIGDAHRPVNRVSRFLPLLVEQAEALRRDRSESQAAQQLNETRPKPVLRAPA